MVWSHAKLARAQVVNFYLQLAVRVAAEAPGALRTHVYSSYFYAKLACGRDGYDYAAVRRWTKALVRAACTTTPCIVVFVFTANADKLITPQDVYAYDLLIVPVNHDNAHWTLAAVWPARRRIEHYCSLGNSAGRDVLATLVHYMMHEAVDKRSPAAPRAADAAPPRWTGCCVRRGVPRQRDGSACGVFTAAMGARLAAGRGAPFGLSQADVPALRLRIAADCLAQRAAPV